MSTQGIGQQIGGVLAPEGRVARMLLTILQHVETSALGLVCLAPAFAFHALVGWQPTHLAIWLGVVAFLPAGPAVFAMLSQSRDFLAEGAYPGHGVRRFAASWLRGARALAGWWLLAGFFGLMLAYNLALYPASDLVLAGSVTGLAALVAATVGLSCHSLLHGPLGLLPRLAAVLAAWARRPHVVLAQVLLAVLAALGTLLPVIGPSLALFLPGLATVGILVVNAMTGFDEHLQAN